MAFPYDPNENKYQTLLQTRKDQFSSQLPQNSQQKNIFSNNSSQILNNGSIPVHVFPINPEQFQLPASQMSQRDPFLDEKTQKRQRDLLSVSVSANPNENKDFSLNNFVRNSNDGNIFLKPLPESNARSLITSRSMAEKPFSSYGQDLKRQILLKETEKKHAKFKEKLLDQKLLLDRMNNDWFGKQGSGAPIRDKFGNIMTSRKKPTNPNYMSSDWSSPNTNYELRQSMPNPQINVLPANEQNLNETQENDVNTSMNLLENSPNLNDNAIEKNPRNTNNFPMATSFETPSNFVDIETFARREREKAAQQENFLIMEAKRKEKENERLLKKQEAELLDIKLQKEKEELEARRMFEYGSLPLESRNLYETNFDMGKLLNKTSRVNFAPNRTLRENPQEKAKKRPRTPVEDVENEIKELKQREEALKIQRKLMQELPLEVSKTVQGTVDVEMQKLKNELNFQQNLLGEQIMNLKGQLLQSNELRQESDKEIRRLQKEVQKTQLVDEIRQRELYMALILKNRKPTIFHTITQKLEEPELVDFRFPERPKPYYNIYDPSIEDLEFRNRDLHEILNNKTEHIPISVGNDDRAHGSHWDQYLEEQERFSHGFSLENGKTPNLPDDFANLQGITQPKIIDDGDQVYYLDMYSTNLKRLEALEEKHPQEELDKLDHQLFNLLKENNTGKNTFDDLEIDRYGISSQKIRFDTTNNHNIESYY